MSISRALDAGVLVRVSRSVCRLASHQFTFEARAMAAWLHCGSRSFLSGFTAAAFHGIRQVPRSRTQITVLNRVPVDSPLWLDASRTTWMIAGDIVNHPAGFRLAHPLRNLHQLAAVLNRHRFERAAEDAWHLGLVTPARAAEYLEQIRCQGRTGVTILAAWLEDAVGRPLPAQSGLEMDALQAFRTVGLPRPIRQHPITLPSGETVHLDMAWPEVKLAVEPGHSWWHGGDLRQRTDQGRDRACAELGWLTIRFDEKMRDDLAAAGRQVKRIHDARRSSRIA